MDKTVDNFKVKLTDDSLSVNTQRGMFLTICFEGCTLIKGLVVMGDQLIKNVPSQDKPQFALFDLEEIPKLGGIEAKQALADYRATRGELQEIRFPSYLLGVVGLALGVLVGNPMVVEGVTATLWWLVTYKLFIKHRNNRQFANFWLAQESALLEADLREAALDWNQRVVTWNHCVRFYYDSASLSDKNRLIAYGERLHQELLILLEVLRILKQAEQHNQLKTGSYNLELWKDDWIA